MQSRQGSSYYFFPTCLLFDFSLVPLLVSGADVMGTDLLSQSNLCTLVERGDPFHHEPRIGPQPPENRAPVSSSWVWLEKTCSVAKQYGVLSEGCWGWPGINVILYTTTLVFHCGWCLNSTNNKSFFSFPSGSWILIPEKSIALILLLSSGSVPLPDQTVWAPEPEPLTWNRQPNMGKVLRTLPGRQ